MPSLRRTVPRHCQPGTVDHEGGQLTKAVAAAYAEVISSGYRLTCVHDSGRGETVELTGDRVLITMGADWLEGELEISLQAVGGRPIPLQDVVDLSHAKALHLHRLPRGVSTGVLTSTLTKTAQLLVAHAADVLAGAPSGLARLGVDVGARGTGR